jgi:hypothetical protein
VGIEMAAELKVVESTQEVTLIHSRDKLLSSEPLPDEFKDRTLSVLQEAGVEVILNDRVVEVTPVDSPDGEPLYDLTLKDGSKMVTSHVIWAISHSIPSTTYLPATSLDAENYVKIVPTYVFTAHPPSQVATNWTKIELRSFVSKLKLPLCSRRHCVLVRNQALRSSHVHGVHGSSQHPPATASATFRHKTEICSYQ